MFFMKTNVINVHNPVTAFKVSVHSHLAFSPIWHLNDLKASAIQYWGIRSSTICHLVPFGMKEFSLHSNLTFGNSMFEHSAFGPIRCMRI